MDIYRLMTTFVRTVRTGNFSAAARDLGITPQAASSHIRQLEGWLGVRLFNRINPKDSHYERETTGGQVISDRPVRWEGSSSH